ncbi:MAG: hypothetical protein ACRDD1_17015 [Planctomycetia bacterium]
MTSPRRTPRPTALLLTAAAVLTAVGAAGDDSPAANRRRLEQLPAAALATLKSDFGRFEKLPESEKARLRRLHADLVASGADRQAYDQTLDRFSVWMKTLTPAEREKFDKVRTRDLADRIAVVRAIVAEQRKMLTADLQSLADGPGDGRPAVGRSPFDGPRGRWLFPGSREFLLAIDGETTPLEKQRLNKLLAQRGPDTVMFVAALAAKYEVEPPFPEAKEIRANALGRLYAGSPKLREMYGKDRYDELSPDQKKLFDRSIVLMYVAPPIDHDKFLEFTAAEKFDATQLRNLTEPPFGTETLVVQFVSLWYYLKNPKERPVELKSDMDELANADPRTGRPKAAAPKPGAVDVPPPLGPFGKAVRKIIESKIERRQPPMD